MHSLRIICVICAAAILSACDPAFETTAQKCRNSQDLGVVIPVPSYEVLANEDEYRLYLERTLELMEPSVALTAEEQAALNFVRSQINAYLDYTQTAGDVTAANNPIDYLESLVATTDPNKEIEAFAIAKQQLAQGIADDDDFCVYTNPNIILNDGSADANIIAYAELQLNYDPFERVVRQTILIAEQQEDLSNIFERTTVPYASTFFATPENFVAKGFTQPEVRQLIANDQISTYATLIFDEGLDTGLGQLELEYINEFCDKDNTSSDTADFAVCSGGETTRTPARSECSHEANKLAEYTFDLTPTLTGMKRLRVEADLTTAEIRIYASPYIKAIYDTDGTTVIRDFTDCELKAVRDELFALDPNSGALTTPVPDLGYDIVYDTDSNGNPVLDADGNQIVISEPTPAFSYQGTL